MLTRELIIYVICNIFFVAGQGNLGDQVWSWWINCAVFVR